MASRSCRYCHRPLVEVDNPLRQEFRHRRGEERTCPGPPLHPEEGDLGAPPDPVPGWDARLEGADAVIARTDPDRNDELADPFLDIAQAQAMIREPEFSTPPPLPPPSDHDPAAHRGTPRTPAGTPPERPGGAHPGDERIVRTAIDGDGYVAVLIFELDGSTTAVPLLDQGGAQVVNGRPVLDIRFDPGPARDLAFELLGRAHEAESKRRENGLGGPPGH